MQITETVDLEFTAYRSPDDGALVVELDYDPNGDDRGLRINLNDGIIYEGNVDKDSSPLAVLAKIAAEHQRTHKQKPEDVAKSDEDFRVFVWRLLHDVKGLDSVIL